MIEDSNRSRTSSGMRIRLGITSRRKPPAIVPAIDPAVIAIRNRLF